MSHDFDLKALRRQLGWTQERMAAELGVDRSSVSRLEGGQQRLRGPVLRLVEHLIVQEVVAIAPDSS